MTSYVILHFLCDLKKSIIGSSKRGFFSKKQMTQNENHSLKDHSIVWMIYEIFKRSDFDESVVDSSIIIKIEWSESLFKSSF